MENTDRKLQSNFELSSPSFDTVCDLNLFFNFDACAGPAPEALTSPSQHTSQPSSVTPPQDDFALLVEDINVGGDFAFDSTMTDDLTITIPKELPADVKSPLPLVLPSESTTAVPLEENKEVCTEDVLDAFLANYSAPTESLHGTSVAPQDLFTTDYWQQKCDVGPFVWDPATDFNLNFLPTEPQSSTTQAKVTAFPAQTAPFFSGLSSASAGEIPFTFSLNPPKSVVPPSFSTTNLQHPRPIAPGSPSFLKTEPVVDNLRLGLVSSIIDVYDHVRFNPVSSTPTLYPHTPKGDFTTPLVDGKVIKRIPRTTKAKDANASAWYSTPPQIPSWGGPTPLNPLFNYNAHGEWSPSQCYSRDEILYYLTERHRLSLPLTIWIQNLPHGCVNRVMDARTLKCRWDGCPAQSGTILKGFWRVCFDERPETSGKQHNPFHNAGYMHLWCLDRCFDLFEISQAFDLRPDTRRFEKEERNPMAMNRDHEDLVMEFETWKEGQKKDYEDWRAEWEINKLLGLPAENRVVDREQKLWYTLTDKHLALQTVARQTKRDSRGGISIDQHKGDLSWYIKKVKERNIRCTRAKKDRDSRTPARLTDCEEVSSDDEDTPETRPLRPTTGDALQQPARVTKSHKAKNNGLKSELKEMDINKRHCCMADDGNFGGEHKRQRRQGRCSI